MLTDLLRDRTTVVWFGLMLATLILWVLGGRNGTHDAYTAVGIILIAFVKVRFVGCYFMELRRAPIAMLILFQGWVAVVATVLIALSVFT